MREPESLAGALNVAATKSDLTPPHDAQDATDIRCILQCPECGTPATIAWSRLSKLLRCKNCHTSFWIGKTGRFESEHDYGKVQYICPRCGKTQNLIAELRVSRVRCTDCDLDVTLPES